jgi:hypothetical protein
MKKKILLFFIIPAFIAGSFGCTQNTGRAPQQPAETRPAPLNAHTNAENVRSPDLWRAGFYKSPAGNLLPAWQYAPPENPFALTFGFGIPDSSASPYIPYSSYYFMLTTRLPLATIGRDGNKELLEYALGEKLAENFHDEAHFSSPVKLEALYTKAEGDGKISGRWSLFPFENNSLLLTEADKKPEQDFFIGSLPLRNLKTLDILLLSPINQVLSFNVGAFDELQESINNRPPPPASRWPWQNFAYFQNSETLPLATLLYQTASSSSSDILFAVKGIELSPSSRLTPAAELFKTTSLHLYVADNPSGKQESAFYVFKFNRNDPSKKALNAFKAQKEQLFKKIKKSCAITESSFSPEDLEKLENGIDNAVLINIELTDKTGKKRESGWIVAEQSARAAELPFRRSYRMLTAAYLSNSLIKLGDLENYSALSLSYIDKNARKQKVTFTNLSEALNEAAGLYTFLSEYTVFTQNFYAEKI